MQTEQFDGRQIERMYTQAIASLLINANGTKKPFEVGNEASAADFANGKSAMWVKGPWNADAILKVNPSFEMGVAFFGNPFGCLN